MALLILADDLTGAADSAARCAYAGLQAAISLVPPSPPLTHSATAFTSDSRYVPPIQAAQRVRESIAGLRDLTGVIWYKKIDSTLRGNLGSEIDAMLETLGKSAAVLCPAFPAQRRGLQDGYLVHDSAQAQPLHLPTMLARQSSRRVAVIPLSVVHAGTLALVDRLVREQTDGAQLFVIDALSDADLQTVVAATTQALPDALWSGSAGLVGVLAQRLVGSSSEAGQIRTEQRCGTDQALIVVGSAAPMAQRQIAYLQRHRIVAVHDATTSLVDNEGDLLLHLPEPPTHITLDSSDARAAAAKLAEVAVSLMTQRRPALLVLVGGDTAACVLNLLGLRQLTVLRELLPGMPLTEGVDAAGQHYCIVFKAGNHGDEATLATLVQRVRSESVISDE